MQLNIKFILTRNPQKKVVQRQPYTNLKYSQIKLRRNCETSAYPRSHFRTVGQVCSICRTITHSYSRTLQSQLYLRLRLRLRLRAEWNCSTGSTAHSFRRCGQAGRGRGEWLKGMFMRLSGVGQGPIFALASTWTLLTTRETWLETFHVTANNRFGPLFSWFLCWSRVSACFGLTLISFNRASAEGRRGKE